MKNFNWKKYVGVLLSIFVLSIGSVGLTGCEAGEEDVEVEELEEEGIEEDELEVEELEEDELEEDELEEDDD